MAKRKPRQGWFNLYIPNLRLYITFYLIEVPWSTVVSKPATVVSGVYRYRKLLWPGARVRGYEDDLLEVV